MGAVILERKLVGVLHLFINIYKDVQIHVCRNGISTTGSSNLRQKKSFSTRLFQTLTRVVGFGAFFWRMTTPFKTFFLNSGLPFFTLHRTRSPGEQFLGFVGSYCHCLNDSDQPLIWEIQTFSDTPRVLEWWETQVQHFRKTRTHYTIIYHPHGPISPSICCLWLPYITPSQDNQVFLPTKVREFVQAAANANNGKDVEIPQGVCRRSQQQCGWEHGQYLHPNPKTVKKSMPFAKNQRSKSINN